MNLHQNAARVKSLIYSIYDGFFYSVMVGFGETYFSAYAVFLGANNFQIGLLSCLPQFLSGVSQVFTLKLFNAISSKKKMVCYGVLVQAFSILPVLGAYFVFDNLKIEYYILMVTLYLTANNIIGPIWNSWMGDLVVKTNKRGTYFGKRNRIVTVGTFISMTIAGILLRFFKGHGLEFWGFFAIFVISIIARLASFYFLSIKLDSPKDSNPNEDKIEFGKFLKGAFKSNQGLLIFYTATVNCGVFFSAGYFTPRMLKGLHFDYLTYTVVLSGVALTKSIFSPLWGELCDQWGTKKVLQFTGFLISFITLPWIFFENPMLLFICQCYAGCVWAGYELSSFTMLLETTSPSERSKISIRLNILTAITSLIGGLGGAILTSSAVNLERPFISAFVASTAIRLIGFFAFGIRLKDPPVKGKINPQEVFIKSTGFKAAFGPVSKLVFYPKRKENKKP